LVDLVVEDTDAEEAERVRARKEGGDFWNRDEQKHFVRTYDVGGEAAGEQIREGFDVRELPSAEPPEFAVDEDEDEGDGEVGGSKGGPQYGSLNEERDAWDSPDRHLWCWQFGVSNCERWSKRSWLGVWLGRELHSAYLYPVGVTKTGFRGNSDNLTSISTVLKTSNLQ
jgi:hypothetical protein